MGGLLMRNCSGTEQGCPPAPRAYPGLAKSDPGLYSAARFRKAPPGAQQNKAPGEALRARGREGLFAAVCVALVSVSLLPAANPPSLKDELAREVIGPRLTMTEVQDYLEARVPRMPALNTPADREKAAERIRQDVLTKVVVRGAAAGWRDARTKVEWLDTIPGGPGYRIKKLRYEAVPGLWVPALLYEPEELKGKVPVSLAVNGHDRNGKAAPYKQIRCIN